MRTRPVSATTPTANTQEPHVHQTVSIPYSERAIGIAGLCSLTINPDYTIHMSVSSVTVNLVPVSLFLANLESLRGISYLWGGKDAHGLDCSGTVTFALKQSDGPDLTQFHNCARLIKECRKEEPLNYKPGLLCFYGMGEEHPIHVMTVIQSPTSKALVAYGAAGGNHYTTSVELAKKIGACVKEKPRLAYRFDFLGAYSWNRLDYTK